MPTQSAVFLLLVETGNTVFGCVLKDTQLLLYFLADPNLQGKPRRCFYLAPICLTCRVW